MTYSAYVAWKQNRRRGVRPKLKAYSEMANEEKSFVRNIEQIVDMQMHNLSQLLSHNGIALNYTEQVRKYLATVGYDAMYGARPVKRTIQREIVGELSKRILAGDVDNTRPIKITMENDLLHFAN